MDEIMFDVSGLTEEDRNVVAHAMLWVMDVFDAPGEIRAMTSILLLSVIDDDEWPRGALSATMAGVNKALALADYAIAEHQYDDDVTDEDRANANANRDNLATVAAKLGEASLLPV